MLPIPAITCWSSSSGLSCRAAAAQRCARSWAPVEPVGDRIEPEPGQLGQLDGDVVGVEHHHLAERARVDEPQLLRRRAGEMQHDVGVRRAAALPAALTSTRPLIRRWIITSSPVSSGQSRYLPRRPIDGDRSRR